MSKLLAPACVLVAFVIGTLAPYPPAMPAIQAQGNLSSGGFFLSAPQYFTQSGVADGTLSVPAGDTSAPSVALSTDEDTGINLAAANVVDVVLNGSQRVRFNGTDLILRSNGQIGFDASGVPDALEVDFTRAASGVIAVNGGIGVSNSTEGEVGRFTRLSSRDSVTLSGATTDSTTITIPSGAKIHGCSFNVDTAVVDDAGDDTWSAAFITGSTTTLATGAAAAADTKVDTLVIDEIASDATEVQFTPNGGSFTSGVIEIVCYYETLTSLDNV